ncbi:MAG: hypothetical protein VX899_04030 [Myxococcota bacterium]|nr:hypothetical protein [Myxococcota bacterium]
MLNTQTIFRDSAIVMALFVVGAAIYGGWQGLQTPALAVLSGGLLGLGNLFLIAQVVKRMTAIAAAPEGSETPAAGPMIAGLLVKTLLSAVLLFGLFQLLNGIWIMGGLASVVAALSLRSVTSLFVVPDPAQEA